MSRLRLVHPRRPQLRAWLDTGAGERVTRHVERCERCARVLEELSADPESVERDVQLGDAIRDAMSPPDDLNERVLQRIEARRLAEREISLFLGLISIPRDAVDLMMPPPIPPPARPEVGPGDEHQREELE